MFELASPRVVRYYLGQAHYRSVLDYRPTSLEEAAAAVERIDGFISKASEKFFPNGGRVWLERMDVPEEFARAMDDDLNVPRALAVLHKTVKIGNSALASGNDDAAREAMFATTKMLDVLGIDAVQNSDADSKTQKSLKSIVQAQLEARAAARAAKDWAASDAIRDTLAAAGVVVEDGADGATWSLKRD